MTITMHQLTHVSVSDSPWRCDTCGWSWSRKPRKVDPCPARKRYADVSVLVKPLDHWRRRGRQVLADQPPIGCYLTPSGYRDLWHYQQTEVIPLPMTAAEGRAQRQRAAWLATCRMCQQEFRQLEIPATDHEQGVCAGCVPRPQQSRWA